MSLNLKGLNVAETDLYYYSCGLSTTPIEYSCPSVCLCVSVCMCECLCVCVCVHDNSKNNSPIHLKLEHIVVYDNIGYRTFCFDL